MFKFNLGIDKLIRDNWAQVFSLDLMMALILVTIVIGLSANAIDLAGFKITDYSAGISVDRIATDAAEILVNTPGSSGWEKSNNTLFVTPGLAEDINGSRNTTNTLSIKKISQLKNRYSELMNNIIPQGGGSSLIIYPTNPALKPVEVNNETPSSNVSEIAVVNRTVLVNFNDFKILVSINTDFNDLNYVSQNSSELCPHYNQKYIDKHEKPDISTKKPGWYCKHFKISQSELDTTDFYIITDPSIPSDISARWILDGPENISELKENFQAYPLLVNDRISKILGDDNEAVLWLHVFISDTSRNSFKTYLVGVPKGTSPEKVNADYLNPQPCFFVFKVWLN